MIKKREITKISKSEINTFINGANDRSEHNLNPKAPRKFKTLTIPMNEYEYKLLIELGEKYGQTHNGIIRFALKELTKK